MRALVLTTSYPARIGLLSGRFLATLLEGLAGRGWDFDVVTPAPAGGGVGGAERPIRVIPVSYPGGHAGGGLAHAAGIPEELARRPLKWLLVPGMLHGLLAEADRRLASGGYDLIWSHWLLPSGALGAGLARRHSLGHLATAHGADVHVLERLARLPGARGRLAALFARTTLIAPAEHTAQRVAHALGGARVACVPLPVASAAGRGAPTGGPLRLLFLGRFEPIKGPDLLLEAAARLDPGCAGDLTFAGAGTLEAALRARAAALAIPVRFPGVLDGPAKEAAIDAAHLVVLSSRRLADGRGEGLPHAAAEALARGVPVVAPREGALGELLARSGAGIVYDARDDGARIGALAAALTAAADPERLGALRVRAARAGQRFASDLVLPRWDQWLRRAQEEAA
ncbi:MAG: hypothetical protein A2W00_10935 [Candidatus Eisenbacteria bacterium RBG_16_71_46]|nr:MAG: hypothetical protein A2W00_10935 [Candidatus Eisenbacteria bacterium RBG_16_71_46]